MTLPTENSNNILILGNGAREKALGETLERNNNTKIYYENSTSVLDIVKKSSEHRICMVIPSNEEFLCGGIVDNFRSLILTQEIKETVIFGPTQKQSQIEGSKRFSKSLMKKLNIPTADYEFFPQHLSELVQAFETMNIKCEDVVIKYSGLAKGKGVYLPKTINEMMDNLSTLYDEHHSNWEGVLVEKRLSGIEVSVLSFCNGSECFLMPQAQDYKKIYDMECGPNTGGMGAIAPANILTQNELSEVQNHMNKVVQHLGYKGILYAGLMKTRDGVFFLEFNCRFGDPETQVLLNLLDAPLLDIFYDCLEGKTPTIRWKQNTYAANVVLSHKYYPSRKLNHLVPIYYSEPINTQQCKIYEANVKYMKNHQDKVIPMTNGGRVLSVVSVANSIKQALQNVYNNIHKICFDGAYYRRDIGFSSRQLPNEILHQSSSVVSPLSSLKVAILASGNGSSAQYLLERTKFVKLIMTNNKDAGVIEKAKTYNLPYFYIQKDYDKMINILSLYEIDIVLLLGFNRIVPASLFTKFYTINIHPSLLPNYKGMMDMNIHRAVVENKDLFTGCTLHEVTGEVDGGWILQQNQFRVNTNDPNALKKQVQQLENLTIYDFLITYEKRIKYDVDIEEGNAFVELLKRENPNIGGFCAEYEIPISNIQSIILGAAADGVGTKLDLAIQYNTLDKIGIDLVAMNVNDLIAGGCKPLFFMDYIALDKMDKVKCRAIIKGILKGCELAGCKLIGGETAEMKGIYLNNKLDLAGFSIGQKIMSLPVLSNIKEGCSIYGLESSGIHSNGYTLVRKLWNNYQERKKRVRGAEIEEDVPSIESILKPTRIYSELLDYFKVYRPFILGIAHITGGGYHDNIIRILPRDKYFELIKWEFPPIFKWIQSESGFSHREMLDTFNCGYGMIIITKPDNEIPNGFLPLPFGKKLGHVINK
jgi:phosphoribosylformylglycinamidine cyclo-ligase